VNDHGRKQNIDHELCAEKVPSAKARLAWLQRQVQKAPERPELWNVSRNCCTEHVMSARKRPSLKEAARARARPAIGTHCVGFVYPDWSTRPRINDLPSNRHLYARWPHSLSKPDQRLQFFERMPMAVELKPELIVVCPGNADRVFDAAAGRKRNRRIEEWPVHTAKQARITAVNALRPPRSIRGRRRAEATTAFAA